MNLSARDKLQLHVSVEELCDGLDRLRELHEELLDVMIEKESALVEVRVEEMENGREREEQLLRRIIEAEKLRLLSTEAVGDLLCHQQPVSITAEEILPFVPEPLAVRFSHSRASLRTVAERLARQNSVNRALIEHSVGHIQLFLSKLACEELGGPGYDESGGSGGADPSSYSSFLMDRRV